MVRVASRAYARKSIGPKIHLPPKKKWSNIFIANFFLLIFFRSVQVPCRNPMMVPRFSLGSIFPRYPFQAVASY